MIRTTDTQTAILRALYHAERGCPVPQTNAFIVAKLGMLPSALTVERRRLSALGLIEKSARDGGSADAELVATLAGAAIGRAEAIREAAEARKAKKRAVVGVLS